MQFCMHVHSHDTARHFRRGPSVWASSSKRNYPDFWGFFKGFICLWMYIHGCCLFYLLILVLIYVDIKRKFCCRATKKCNKQKSRDSLNFPFHCCCSFSRKLVFSALLDLMPMESLPVVLERVNLMIHIIPSCPGLPRAFNKSFVTLVLSCIVFIWRSVVWSCKWFFSVSS